MGRTHLQRSHSLTEQRRIPYNSLKDSSTLAQHGYVHVQGTGHHVGIDRDIGVRVHHACQ
eukprot:5591680-Prymnesium_polylepis.1